MKFKLITIVMVLTAVMLAGCGKKDAELQTDVTNALSSNSALSGVSVQVKDHVATLTGEVADDAAKAAAGAAASGVKGIKSVVNNITVAPPTPTAAASTSDASSITSALNKAGFTGVTVDTSTSPATLRGTVPKGKMQAAVQTAQQAAGKPLKNELTEK